MPVLCFSCCSPEGSGRFSGAVPCVSWRCQRYSPARPGTRPDNAVHSTISRSHQWVLSLRKMHARPSIFQGNNTDWCRLGGGIGGVRLWRLGSLGLASFLIRFLLALGHNIPFGSYRALAHYAPGSRNLVATNRYLYSESRRAREARSDRISTISPRIHRAWHRSFLLRMRELQPRF